MRTLFLFLLLMASSFLGMTQERNPIGTKSFNSAAKITLELVARNQSFRKETENAKDVFDSSIDSPKSVLFSADGRKYYVQSLEGYVTTVYNAATHKKIKEIKHVFDESNQRLFKGSENTVLDYEQSLIKELPNHFSGKPVEACLSHKGKYLWVTYYRRSWDLNAQYPSAVAIINTKTDNIVRVIPTGPLPKMIAASKDGKYVAITHWGDNTIGIIDVQSKNPYDFAFKHHPKTDNQLKLKYSENSIVDRDNNCGSCLRGTVFTDDSKYLLVGKMGGEGGIAVFDVQNEFKKQATLFGMEENLRHLVISKGYLYLSTNRTGNVQKAKVSDLIEECMLTKTEQVDFEKFESQFLGSGVRTISLSPNGKFIFAAVNNSCKIVVLDAKTLEILNEISADPYPVGMAHSRIKNELIVTAQGKGDQGGNSVMVYKVNY